MSDKVRRNYALDAVIAIAFILSAISGILLWLASPGGYRGGRNPDFHSAILGVSRWTWSDLHIWISLVLVVGVVTHFVLHWSWIVCVTKRLLRPVDRRTQASCPTA